ncbi:MAG TPA: HAMP domain-containing sensor histidine kinase [Kineosporiaceae bacterium]|nr:HAMP domain-containing sensor histidine kinase [Kineosporiaceae bacterium]
MSRATTALGRRRRSAGLATRLLAAFILVVLSGTITAWLVAAAVSPGLFHAHMRQAGPHVSPEATAHAEQAFRSANGLSLAFALLASLIASVAVAVYLTRRLGRSLQPLSKAAVEVSDGRYDVHVPMPGLGSEFDDLVIAFNQMAGQLQRVELTRRRLLADLAHELRTPVATLDAYLDALEDGVATLSGDTLDVLRTQTRRLTRLAEDVSAVSRAEEHQLPFKPVPLPPGELVAASCAAAADRFAEREVHLRPAVAPHLPLVEVDPDRMGQVLGNLLDNALRHTPPGGEVTVSADLVAPGTVQLQVRDNGEGIAAEHLPHVFERFYRVDAARDRGRGGSGIGLAIVKALVEAHGGRVRVSSDGPGRGTTFTVLLAPVGQMSQTSTSR